ncbi:MAG: B12-binding domain-containing radical SAM protein [Desulfobacteraceae bacterium]|nr:B12-binding domain-containing radical SAM protein [Desulfobacteraceae bacterium]
MRILLINPSASSVFNALGVVFPPLGLLYIATAARAAGHDVTVLDQMVDHRKLDFSNFDVVGIHSDTTRFFEAMALARQARRSGSKVVLGGPHPCFDTRSIFESGDVDAIVRGEGEQSFVALLDAWQNGQSGLAIKGVLVKHKHRISDGGPPDLIQDVDALPVPARDFLNTALYQRTRLDGWPLTSLHTSRGCPFQCRFCASSRLEGSAWRARSADSVLEEIDNLVSMGYRALAFLDDNFTGSKDRISNICDGILKKGWKLRWWCFCRVDTIVRNPEMIAQMVRAGAYSIFVGIESPSSNILSESNKGIKAEQAREAVQILKANGLNIWSSYILGFASQNRRSIRDTIKFACELNTTTAQFTILTPYPGTELWDELESRLIEKAGKGFDGVHAIFRHPHIAPFEMQMWHIWAYIRFYMRNKDSILGFIRFLRLRKFGLHLLTQ